MAGMADARRCKATKNDGTPCKAGALPGGEFCYFHSPERAEQRAEARRAGGRERSRKAAVLPADSPDLRLKTAQDVAKALARTVNEVRKGAVDAKVANAVGYLCGMILKAIEAGELAERVAALERGAAQKGTA
jgi:hypothetical protein